MHTENGRVQVWEDGAWKMWRVAKPPNPVRQWVSCDGYDGTDTCGRLLRPTSTNESAD